MIDVKKAYNIWLEELNSISGKQAKELMALTEDEVVNGFADEIQFGTGGLRGVIGLGPNKINIYTVRKVSNALCEYHKGNEDRGVVIAYDSRKNSDIFSNVVADTFLKAGFKVYLFDTLVPVAVLSYNIPKLNAICGVMITASHNPPQYNGYKVYDKRGVQAIPADAKEIIEIYKKTQLFDGKLPEVELQPSDRLVILGEDYVNDYLEYIDGLLTQKAVFTEKGKDISIIYSPIHGTGYVPIKTMLDRIGFDDVRYVQTNPDSNFGGLKMPNPESLDVYEEALELSKQRRADMMFSTDPDCDRVGVLVDHEGEYISLNGNQLGALMLDYLIETQDCSGGALVTTIVSGGLAKNIALANGLEVYLDLTGFKFIGHRAHGWQTDSGPKFIFGYEESYGYLTGDYVHDKDGVISAMLICAIALKEKLSGGNMYKRWLALCDKYGYFSEDLETRKLPIIGFRETIATAMSKLRENLFEPIGDKQVVYVEDYETGCRIYPDGKKTKLDIPDKSNVLKFFTDDDNWVAVRPSGTEPKIKLYFAVKGKDEADADAITRVLKDNMIVRVDALI